MLKVLAVVGVLSVVVFHAWTRRKRIFTKHNIKVALTTLGAVAGATALCATIVTLF